jgi:UDP-N-acetylmuramate-alanine ligase
MRGVSGCVVEYAASAAEAVKVLVNRAKAGDVILTLGAGSVSQVGVLMLESLATNA